jgi:IS5 family transposase
VAFPTDARLLNKARLTLVRRAHKLGVVLRQSYRDVGRAAFVRSQHSAHARQYNRAQAQTRKLRTYLGRIIRDIERKTQATPEHSKLARLLEISRRIWSQRKKRKEGEAPKLYSVHAPAVECIAKGKAHKQYEFGVKVGIVSTNKESFVVGARALPGNPYDGHTLKECLEQVLRVTKVAPEEVYTDRGYKGHGCRADELTVWIAGTKRGVTKAIHRKLKRRIAVEPIIGHMRSDGRLQRNFLEGVDGDAINALLCGAGQNMRKILKKLRLFCACWRLRLTAVMHLRLLQRTEISPLDL